MIMEFKEKLEQLENKFNNIKEILDPESLRGELFKLDQEMGRPDFWNDTKKAQEISSKRNAIANKIQEIESVEKKINDIKEFIELLELEYDKETEDEIKREIEALDKEITKLETASLLSEEYDMKML